MDVRGFGERDDRRHPLLARRRPAAQAHLGARGPPRPSYGHVGMQEVEVASALTALTMPGEDGWSLNPYVGCLHACAYCYVPDTMRLQREAWGGYVAAKWNIASLLARELRTRPPKPVYMCTSTDPYQAPEAEHRLTRACLELLARHDWPVRLLTRSPLILRDLDLLLRIDDLRVGFSVPTLDDGVRALLEPGAPPIASRLSALRRLADAGLETYVNHCPAMPSPSHAPADVARAFAAAGVRTVRASRWHYVDGFRAQLASRLAGTPHEDLATYVADQARQQRYLAALEVAFQREGLHVEHSMGGATSPISGTGVERHRQGTLTGLPGMESAWTA